MTIPERAQQLNPAVAARISPPTMAVPPPPNGQPCNACYPSTSTVPNTRIVHCDLPAGHDGDHVETDTESSWPACCPGESLRGDPHGMHTHDCPTYLAFVESWQQAMTKPKRVTVLPPSATEQPIVVEHAIGMSGGSMQVRNDHPEIERIYPLAKWIPDHQRHGGKVYTRRVIVVDDWTEVPPS